MLTNLEIANVKGLPSDIVESEVSYSNDCPESSEKYLLAFLALIVIFESNLYSEVYLIDRWLIWNN